MSMMVAHIAIPKAEIAALCRRNGIRKLALFGSVLTDRFSDRSDINVLVEFRPHERIGVFRLSNSGRAKPASRWAHNRLENAHGLEPAFPGRSCARCRGGLCRAPIPFA
jgi:predicted nucleotidyltransferase